jgi:hypothetical protein
MIQEDKSMARVAKPLVLAMLAAVWIPACSSTPKNPSPPVPVGGERSDISALAGRWDGEYSSEATGRSGSIVFELKPGDKIARGDVLMIPRGGQAPAPKPGAPIPQVLNIGFVSAAGGVLTGTMDPYVSPDCDCEVQTTFVGRLSGDTVEGTFTTTPAGNAPITTGRWKMTRKKT